MCCCDLSGPVWRSEPLYPRNYCLASSGGLEREQRSSLSHPMTDRRCQDYWGGEWREERRRKGEMGEAWPDGDFPLFTLPLSLPINGGTGTIGSALCHWEETQCPHLAARRFDLPLLQAWMQVYSLCEGTGSQRMGEEGRGLRGGKEGVSQTPMLTPVSTWQVKQVPQR